MCSTCRPADRLVVNALQFQQVQSGADGGQRIAQLVREHGEEFILASIGVAHCGVEGGILDGYAGASGDVFGQR
jgi:hypothetical protein